MSFYVYKPVNIPQEFYATFDGYLVYKNSRGIWNYATVEKGGISKTDYVVGAVIPSVVRLKPYDSKISLTAPILGTDRAESSVSASQMIYTPPDVQREIKLPGMYSPYSSENTQKSDFAAIGNWQKSVDRIGVLDRPVIPVAWKGEYPEIIYAWTGTQWKQINARSKNIKALSTIRREIYDLTVYTNKLNALNWTAEDTYALSQSARTWGYQWLGTINTGRDF